MKRSKKTTALFSGRTRLLVLTGLLAAWTCVATAALTIPSPTGGYVHLGDTVVLLSAWLLGPVYGALAAGIGSALADMLAGYVIYAPATLAIKVLMAIIGALVYEKRKSCRWGMVAAGAAGEVPMVLGYWLYDGLLSGSLRAASAGIPANLAQAAFGVAASALLAAAFRANGWLRREFPRLG